MVAIVLLLVFGLYIFKLTGQVCFLLPRIHHFPDGNENTVPSNSSLMVSPDAAAPFIRKSAGSSH
jgi:hypothetical protein